MSRDLGHFISKRRTRMYGPTVAMHSRRLHDSHVRQAVALQGDSARHSFLNPENPGSSVSLTLHAQTPEAEARTRRSPHRRASLIRARKAPATSTIKTEITRMEARISRKGKVLTDQALDAAGCDVFCVAGWPFGIMPDHLTVSLEELLTFLQTRLLAAEETDE